MATVGSSFCVPDWEGNDTELLSQRIFESVPLIKRKKKRKRAKGNAEEIPVDTKKKAVVITAGGENSLPDSVDYSYLDALTPEERLSILLSKLKSSPEGEKAKRSKTRKKRKKGIENKKEGIGEGDVNGRAEKTNTKERRPYDKTAKLTADEISTLDSNSEKGIKASEHSKAKSRKMKKKKATDENGINQLGFNTGVKLEECNKTEKIQGKKLKRKKAKEVKVDSRNVEKVYDLHTSENDGDGSLEDRKDRKEANQDELSGSNDSFHAESKEESAQGDKIVENDMEGVCKRNSKNDLKSKLQRKLSGAQFRWINEQLYTITSDSAFEIFSKDPSLFDVYHKGFQNQVQLWPQNPIDLMIKDLKSRPADLVVADMGCGEATIAQSVRQKVHSFDLVARNRYITACDMSQLPLQSQTVDVVIFCLSLMGKNVADFLLEANRILKTGGLLKIAEVVSRFDSVDRFIEDVSKFGFNVLSKDSSNKMFVLMDFERARQTDSRRPIEINLKPCVYKKR